MEGHMPTTTHNSKEDLVEALWEKMIEAGADQGLISCVAQMTLHLVPGPDDVDGYDKLVDAIVQYAWKRGAYDLLHAMELGAIHSILPKQTQGNN
jgi:hypothetical protein